jgi:hypothetical protein
MIRILRVSILTLACTSTLTLYSQAPDITATPETVVANSLAGLSGVNIPNLALTGNAEMIVGSTDETGTFSASCSVGGRAA